MLKKIAITALACMLCVAAFAAEKKFGVPVYPGAKYDAIRTELSQSMANGGETAAYRTGDGIAAVAGYYRGQGLVALRMGGNSNERAHFKDLKKDVDVVVQNPWKDPESKTVMHDTLILILKEGKQPQ